MLLNMRIFLSLLLLTGLSSQGAAASLKTGLVCASAAAEKTLGMVDSGLRRTCFTGRFEIKVKGFHWDSPRFQVSFKNGRVSVQDLVAGVPAKAQITAGPEFPLPILSVTTMEDSGEEMITTVSRLMIVAQKEAESAQVLYSLQALDVVSSLHSYGEASTQVEHYSGDDLLLSRVVP